MARKAKKKQGDFASRVSSNDSSSLLVRVEENLGPSCLPGVNEWLPTGSTFLDCAVHPKGFGLPGGTLTQIIGPEGKGKTLLAMIICASAQSEGGKVIWADRENRFSPALASLAGMIIDDENWFDRRIPPCLEGYIAALQDMLESEIEIHKSIRKEGNSPAPTVFVLDSVASLGHSREREEQKPLPMLMAQQWTLFARSRAATHMGGSNIHLIFINQLRDNVDFFSAGVKTDRVPGGRSLKYMSSTIIHVSQEALESSQKVEDENPGFSMGANLLFKVTKNSVGPPNREGYLPFFFAKGPMDEIACLTFVLSPLVQKKFKPSWEPAGSWVKHGGESKYRKDWIALLSDHTGELYQSLRKEVMEIYKSLSLYELPT